MNNESFWAKYDWGKAALLVFCLLLLANIIILDVKVFIPDISKMFKKQLSDGVAPATHLEGESLTDASEVSQETTANTPGVSQTNLCPVSCLETIFEATNAALAQISPQPAPVIVSGGKTNEFFVALGGGSTRAENWEDLVGLEAYIDSSKYGKIKEVVFEAGVKIPNGNQRAYARLFNVTDKHPVWFSEVWLEGGTPRLLVSEPISLAEGRKLYRVQMKTTLKDLAILTQARLKITTQ